MNRPSLRRTFLACGAAATVGAGMLGATSAVVLGAGTASAAPCVQSIQPYNPYLQTCGIPNAPVTVPGQAPGAGAIIACRGIQGCLSQVVNGPGIIAVPRPDTRVRQSR